MAGAGGLSDNFPGVVMKICDLDTQQVSDTGAPFNKPTSSYAVSDMGNKNSFNAKI